MSIAPNLLLTAQLIIYATHRISIGRLQREFNMGYNRAVQIVEALVSEGVIAPSNDQGDYTPLFRHPKWKTIAALSHLWEQYVPDDYPAPFKCRERPDGQWEAVQYMMVDFEPPEFEQVTFVGQTKEAVWTWLINAPQPIVPLSIALTRVSSGRAELVKQLYAQLPHHAFITQIKEKFGALRIHVLESDPEVSTLIRHISKQSLSTCETCGEAGTLRRSGSWINVRCDAHIMPDGLRSADYTPAEM